ncbi:CBS domain-containing protein [Atopobacter sp. AH10]|uniref:DRTGG domain-containing protein n=1 Tax=Atopobacter sp. AH10 TaxID=2315861 RepID=UPI000EF184F1|nr:DRTGG domain-containing protein [Atopobacter sp. AH10]RLK63257.1 CBS domain-containing protein [Atopobacter sp. AH10]
MSKHHQILEYIESLPVGKKISVRSIAKTMDMSDGTAYRAIKEAEKEGLVSTIERVGTIRIESKKDRLIEQLTFEEVVNITDGEVYGGQVGLKQPLERFVIGAMTVEAMERYLIEHGIMIVGNRRDAQRKALENGMAVLITGGFEPDHDLIDLANLKGLPIIGTAYDSFTVASILNKAMMNQLIKKKVALVSDIYTPLKDTAVLYPDDTVKDYHHLSMTTGHSRFPVVHHDNRLIGIITAKDTVGKSNRTTLDRVITKDPAYTKMTSTVASVAHLMIWNSLELLPVVEDKLTLLGILSREDVMKAMQTSQRQPQNTNTVEELVMESLSNPQPDAMIYNYHVTPQMTSQMGTLSFGVLCEYVAIATHEQVFQSFTARSVIDEMSIHYFRMIQIDSDVRVKLGVLNTSRRAIRYDVDIFVNNELHAKGYVSVQLMDK